MKAPARVAAQHQSLLHFVGQAPWSDAAVLTKVRDLVLPAIEGTGPIEAWIIDDTGFPKKGRRARGNHLPDQAGDRPRSAPCGGGSRPAARRRPDGCGLWQRYAAAHRR